MRKARLSCQLFTGFPAVVQTSQCGEGVVHQRLAAVESPLGEQTHRPGCGLLACTFSSQVVFDSFNNFFYAMC
jgi:hypothetical protein